MTEKGLVRRDAAARTHVYRARVSEGATQRRLVSDLLERAFGGSALGLVMQALSTKRVTRREMQQIRDLLDAMNGGE